MLSTDNGGITLFSRTDVCKYQLKNSPYIRVIDNGNVQIWKSL